MAENRRQHGHRTLKVKCATWDQVEAFCTRKVRAGNRLPMRVPFTAEAGQRIALALELPSKLVVSIEGSVLECQPAPDGKKSSVVLELSGLTDELRIRLTELVADGRAGSSGSIRVPPPDSAEAPAPMPADAPVFELVPPPEEVDGSGVLADERNVFDILEAHLKRLKESAAHEVLGVVWDAGVEDIRTSYFGLIKQFHPDVYARYESPEIGELAQEAFIHINRAYDRMRDAAVEAGAGIIAGPALLPHQGWMVADWSDIGELADTPAPAPLPARRTRAPSSPGIVVREPVIQPEPMTAETIGEPDEVSESKPLTAASLAGEPAEAEAPPDADAIMHQARELLEVDDADGARAVLAKALRADPRNRSVRALYHVAAGRKLMADDEGAKAIAQYEAALAHDRDCAEARAALEAARERAGGAAGKKAGLFKRLFR